MQVLTEWLGRSMYTTGMTLEDCLYRPALRAQPANAQLAHLLQRSLDLGVERTRRILVPHAVRKVALDTTELLVAVRRKVRLQPHHALEGRVEVRDAQVEQLRQLFSQLAVERLEDFARLLLLLLGLRLGVRKVSG